MSWGGQNNLRWQKNLGWQNDLGVAECLAKVQCLLTTVCTWSSCVKSGGFGSAHGHVCLGQCQRYLKHFVLC